MGEINPKNEGNGGNPMDGNGLTTLFLNKKCTGGMSKLGGFTVKMLL